ncbi:MAG: M14-type cytosolic carboxypeptidase [Armatimonadota bacterium]
MRTIGISFESHFEGGNGELLAIDGDEVCFRVDKRKSPVCLWWYVKLDGVAGRRVRLVLQEVSARAGGAMEYADGKVRPVASVDGGPWRRLRPGFVDAEADKVTFEVPFASTARRARVAFCYPYVYSDLWRACRQWRKLPGVSVGSLVTSQGGRDVPLLLIGDPDSAPRDMVAIVARQHAGETPGSFVLEGILEALTGSGPVGKWARSKALIAVVPAVDVDNVAEGGYGKDERPVDYNRDWLKPRRPQTKALRRLLADLASRHRYRVFLDLHAPWTADPNMLVWTPPELVDEATGRAQDRLARLIFAHQTAAFDVAWSDCLATPESWGNWQLMSGIRQAIDHGVASVCVETTYHRTHAGRWASPHLYRGHGRAIARAVVDFCREDS